MPPPPLALPSDPISSLIKLNTLPPAEVDPSKSSSNQHKRHCLFLAKVSSSFGKPEQIEVEGNRGAVGFETEMCWGEEPGRRLL